MSSTSAPGSSIRVGIVGTGFAASSHLDALRRVRGIEVAGVVGSSEERARSAADRLGAGRAYPDVEALLGDETVHAIHVCTPNHLHAPVTLAALAAGKHVLSEKPLGLDAAESSILAEAAAGSDVVTGVCFNYRHFPLVQQARAEVAARGPVHFVHGGYLQDWLLYRGDWNWRLESARAGTTRAMGDIGSHWVDTVEHVLGDRVTGVTADLGRLHEERLRPDAEIETFAGAGDGAGDDGTAVRVDTEDFGSVLLRFERGTRGTFAVSQVSPGRKNRLWFQVDVREASYAWDQEEPNRLWVGRRDEANRELVRDPSLLDPPAAALAHFPGGHQEGWPDALRNLFEDFYAAVTAHRAGEAYRPTFASFDEARHVARVIEAIARSDRVRSWATVEADAPARAAERTKEDAP